MTAETRNNISASSIGQKLKEAREKKGLSIDQVQKQTHIHSTVLVALENGTCDEMLTATYVRSFLKKYAAYLGLDVKHILGEYPSSRPEPKVEAVKAPPAAATESAPDISNFLSAAKATLVAVVILFLIVSLGKTVVSSFKRHAPLNKAPVSATARPRTASRRSAAKEIKDVSQNKSAVKALPENRSFNLVVKVKQNVYLKVKKDGELLFGSVIHKGSMESFNAEEKISLDVAKAEAIELILDGKPMGSIGRGVIKNLEITKKGIKK